MASCSKCGKNVGCACNLAQGMCLQCYNANMNVSPATTVGKSTYSSPVQYSQPDAKPITEFEQILQTPGISKQEKIRRINEILEKAKQKI